MGLGDLNKEYTSEDMARARKEGFLDGQLASSGVEKLGVEFIEIYKRLWERIYSESRAS